MKKLTWEKFIKKEKLTAKDLEELLAQTNNEIKEWISFKEKIIEQIKKCE